MNFSHSRESANEMKILRKINFFMQIFLILCCCIIFSFFLNFFLCIQLLLPHFLKATLTSPSRHSFLFRLFLFFGVFVCNDAIWRVNLNILLIWLLYEMLYDREKVDLLAGLAGFLTDSIAPSNLTYSSTLDFIMENDDLFTIIYVSRASEQEWKWNRKKFFPGKKSLEKNKVACSLYPISWILFL